jgi:hypothetical protein
MENSRGKLEGIFCIEGKLDFSPSSAKTRVLFPNPMEIEIGKIWIFANAANIVLFRCVCHVSIVWTPAVGGQSHAPLVHMRTKILR